MIHQFFGMGTLSTWLLRQFQWIWHGEFRTDKFRSAHLGGSVDHPMETAAV